MRTHISIGGTAANKHAEILAATFKGWGNSANVSKQATEKPAITSTPLTFIGKH